MLQPYPQDYRRIVFGAPAPADTNFEHLTYIGTVRRVFEEKRRDPICAPFADYLRSSGSSTPDLESYRMAQKTLTGSYNALRRYDIQEPDPTQYQAFVLLATDWFERSIRHIATNCRVLSYEEVYDYLDLGKSPGYPWSYVHNDKFSYLNSEDGLFLQKYWNALATDSPIVSFCAFSLKSELVSRAKWEADQPRSTGAMDTNHVVASHALCLDFNMRIQERPLDTRSAVGLSPFQNGWLLLRNKLAVVGRALAIDGSRHDARVYLYQIMCIYTVRWRCLRACDRTQANATRLRNIALQDILAHVVNVDGTVWDKYIGKSSGTGNTTSDNGAVVQIDMACVYLLVTPTRYHDYDTWSRLTQSAITGDDILEAYAAEIEPYYTADTVGAAGKVIGKVYTFETPVPVPVEQLTFCSMGFVTLSHGRETYLAPLHNCAKAVCSMLRGGADAEPRSVMIARLCGLYLMAFPCPHCRPLFQGFADHLRALWRDDPSTHSAWKAWLEPDQLIQLYFGRETRHIVRQANGGPPPKATVVVAYPSPPEHARASPDMTRKKIKIVSVKRTKSTKKAVKHAAKKAVVQAVADTVLRGSGDYRPTQFRQLKGRGDYKSTGSSIGSALGGAVGGIGDLLSGAFKAITGMGDYKTHGPKYNTVHNLTQTSDPLQLSKMNVKFAGGPPRVQHRELVGVVTAQAGLTGFLTTVYRIQPGLRGAGSLFPWLSSVASCFQQYVLHGCVFEFESTSSEYSAQVGLGQIMLSTVYDAEAQPLADVISIGNNEYTSIGKPSENIVHAIECAPKENSTMVRYVRSSNTVNAGVTDDRLDDVGIFQVSTNGIPSSVPVGTQLGMLWVTYDIEFLKPEMPDIHVGTTAAFTTSTTGAPTGSNFGVNLLANKDNSLPAKFVSGTLVMPSSYNGNYLLITTTTANVIGSNTTSITGVGTSILGLPNYFGGVSGAKGFSTFGLMSPAVDALRGSTTTLMYAFSCTGVGSDSDRTIAFLPPTYASAGTMWSNIYIVPLDNDIVGSTLTRVLERLSKQELIDLMEEAAPRMLEASSSSPPPPPVRRESFSSELGEYHEADTSSRVADLPNLPASQLAALRTFLNMTQ